MINYSIIIPHKNTPELLRKCLDSIPRRDDIQIIVVDDNSDADKVDFEHFPGMGEPHTEVYLTKEGRGAGYARNVGLEHAKGKWIVFSDADDYFMPEFANAMDDFVGSDNEIIFFKCTSQQAYTGLPGKRFVDFNQIIDKAKSSGNFSVLLQNTTPVMKFFKRSVIVSNDIRFQEVRWGNDVYFYSKYVACSDKYLASDYMIYCVTDGASSLASNKTIESLKVRFDVELNAIQLLIPKMDVSYSMFWMYKRWWSIWRLDKIYALRILPRMVWKSRGKVIKYVVKNFAVDEYNSSPQLKKIVKKIKGKV